MNTAPAISAIPKFSGLPLVGNLFDFRRDRIGLVQRIAAKCGDVGFMRLGPFRVIVLSGPEPIHAALVDHPDAFIKSLGLRRYGRPLVGQGILSSEGDLHKRQRRLLGPAFSQRRLVTYADRMVEEAVRFADALVDGSTVNLADEMMELTLAIVGKVLFDVDVQHEASTIHHALTEAMKYMVVSISSLVNFPYRWPTPRNRKMHHAVAALDAIVYRIIAERRQNPGDRGDVLSMLLEARDDDGSAMSDQQIRDEVMTLILAGHETTANALAWTWQLLVTHPLVYDQVTQEIETVLGGRRPTFADLPQLPLVHQVIKESMRLYPPAYLTAREAIADVDIGAVKVSKGGFVAINIFGMHHRADLFPDPEEFRPERFAADEEKKIPKGAYLPFGAGPRVCIGNHFAMMEIALLLTAIAQKHRFAPLNKDFPEPEPLVTLRPRGGVLAQV